MRSPVSALNKTLYNRLQAANICPGYDSIPSGKKMPYWVLTDTIIKPWGSKTTKGAEAFPNIKVFSDYQGDKEVAELTDKIIAAVTETRLVMTDDWTVVKCSVADHGIDRSNGYREATIQFQFLLFDKRE